MQPDMGGSKRAVYSKFLDSDVVICYKRKIKQRNRCWRRTNRRSKKEEM
jgi:hypothetical protein